MQRRKQASKEGKEYKEIKEELKLNYPEALLVDGFDRALIGITMDTEARAVYSYEEMLEIARKDIKGHDVDEAADYIAHEVLGSIPYLESSKAPVIVQRAF